LAPPRQPDRPERAERPQRLEPTGHAGEDIEVEVLANQAGRSSGYLLHCGDTHVLVDCGPGTTAALDRRARLLDIDAVIITHQHADHAADVIGLAYARRFPDPLDKIPLHAPAATLDMLDRLDDLFAVPTLPAMGNTIEASFDLHPLARDGSAIALAAGVELTSFPARHAVPSAALRITTGATTICFSSDTARCDGVLAAARRSNLFICEATYLTASPDELEGHGHLTPAHAGQIAGRAEADHLALTHLARPGAREATARAAAGEFDPTRTTITRPGDRLGAHGLRPTPP
jgi:ribonuclease BN (tRNA processing enzyme)